MIRIILSAMLFLCGCSQGGGPSNKSDERGSDYQAWHDAKAKTDLAVAEAINEPGGGDYAKAVAVIQAAPFPEAIKNYEAGQLIVGSFNGKVVRRPKESLAEGLGMLEQAAAVPGETARVAPQQLRLVFERGVQPPDGNGITIDPVIADCWRKLENHGSGDPAACIMLRQKRMPQLDRP